MVKELGKTTSIEIKCNIEDRNDIIQHYEKDGFKLQTIFISKGYGTDKDTYKITFAKGSL